ncbi:MAG: stage 0 sporulation family protein [Vescimonas sp.]|uniref:PSP1 domain-containing protein n=1 Tax=Vescimonas sp. TaxID=2892404 RepID=UPI002A91AC4F|nr:stage 0 sporulation family protein [Vescimonas sp.]MDY5333657.1 stage 0 sporulation family protein [Vescimonas sp.]
MTEVISVRFRNGCKEYYFDPKGLTVPTDTDVIVETAQGPEFARCSQGNHQVEDDAVVKPLRGLIRIATDNDRHTAAYNRGREKEAFEVCKKKIQQHKLEMKLVRVECSFDGSKILFFFTADGRVDFRELVKDLAGVFRARIELRQIGVRDEAKMIGGLGICGRPFCCSQFMDEFLPVSIKMAKTQSLSLNPTKISGTCGRLMCCLKYEQDAYEDAIRRMPKNDSFVLTPDGTGNVSDINVLKETVSVRLDDRPEGARCYHNCEVCVLRNGKGSREGIVVPDKRPERYIEPIAEEELPAITLVSDFDPDAAAAEDGKRRRSRGGRGRRRGENAGEHPAEKAAADNKPARSEKADKPAGDKPNREGGSRRRRSGRRGSGSGQAAPAAAEAAPKKQERPAGEAPAGEKKRNNNRRRPRRRSGGGGKPNGGAEA